MSNQKEILSGFQQENSEIKHICLLSDNIGSLFLQPDFSDLTLIVENQRFPVHKVILAASSDYFRALLYGGLKESVSHQDEIELKDTAVNGFYHLLKYIYTGCINLVDLKEEIVLEILALSNQYAFVKLQAAISDYLKIILNNQNVCLIFDMATVFNLKSLCETCCEFMDKNAVDILKSDSFLTLSSNSLENLLSHDSFCAPEIEIFKSVQLWAENNGEITICKSIMKLIRFPLISLEDLLNIVRCSKFVSADTILDAIKIKNDFKNTDLPYRGFLFSNENMASMRHDAKVKYGEMKDSLLDGDNQNYDLDHGFTRHQIDDNNGQGIVIQLGMPCIINNIRMLLWDRDARSYSYYIEASLDCKDWVELINHRNYLCRSWQNLKFPARVLKYIRVVGTHNSVNRIFHLVSFECYYTTEPFTLQDGLVVPDYNVATIKNSAWVIEGVSRSRNALINGDIMKYDWDSGYTCHQLGSGAIVVQLAQPYIIGSMRLLLWDCDNRYYSYYVEVSNDQQSWTRVVDKTQLPCKSWQFFTFKKQDITFIKIVGTNNTANEVFHCVHFECPADENVVRDFTKKQKNKTDFDSNFNNMDTNERITSSTQNISQSNHLSIIAVDSISNMQQLSTVSSNHLTNTTFSSSHAGSNHSSFTSGSMRTIENNAGIRPTLVQTNNGGIRSILVQPNALRLQGLNNLVREDNNIIDQGDGYGVGFLGGGGINLSANP